MTGVPEQAVTAAKAEAILRESAFDDWYSNVILPVTDRTYDIAHEAYCAGWDAATPPGVVVLPGEVTDEQVAELRKRWAAGSGSTP